MATIITLSAMSDSGWAKVFIDGNEVLSSPGTTSVSLENGTHFLTYFIQGSPGNNYQVGIINPPEEIWGAAGKLKTNHTTGQHAITI
jgi:hypothetical protein